ncbi:twin arginine-targeting protein translocase TatB [Gammaproteobacteria bacterium 45_16_T64]|nr:twin arginine-targeting protein translocase TatB [Gammaproteobacteria bacterium 45_16_T64]
MFDIGFFELILIAIIGLVVLGPERLPHAIRMTSAWVGKIRRASVAVKDELEREINAHEMQQRIQQQIEKAGLEDAKKSVESAANTALKETVTEPTKPATPSKPPASAP